MISGIRPLKTLLADAPGGPITGPGPPPVTATMTAFGQAAMQSMCATRVWITILRDSRPSTVGGDGTSDVNPLPTLAGETVMESVYGTEIQTLGVENCLRSYDSTRFKIVSQQCITTSFQTPHKWFDIKFNVNQKVRYKPPRTFVPPAPPPANPPSNPLNYGLVVMFTTLHPVIPIAWGSSLSPVEVSRQSARTYFIDS